MFHTIAFSYNNATTSPPGSRASGQLLPVPAVADTFFSASGTNAFLLPAEMKLVAAFTMSPTLDRARINSPSLLRVALSHIRPIQQGALPTTDPNVMADYVGEIEFPAGEPVGVDAAVLDPGEPSIFALLWFAHRKLTPIPPGNAYWVHYTVESSTVPASGVTRLAVLSPPSDTADLVTPFRWSPLALSFEQTLPSGTYAVIGFEHTGPSAVAARLVFPGSAFRPGTVAMTSKGARTFDRVYDGSLGTYGIFRTAAPPAIEVLASSSDLITSHEGFLRVIRVGDLHDERYQPHTLARTASHPVAEATPTEEPSAEPPCACAPTTLEAQAMALLRRLRGSNP
jgi:hypothetical protein